MLPFHISKTFGLQSKTHGMALLNEKGIRLVFRDADALEENRDEDAESLYIEWANLVDWEVKRGLLGDVLRFKVRGMSGTDPDGREDKLVELELQKRDRPALDRFEKVFEEYRSGRRKDDVDNVLDDVRDFLDRI